MSSLVQRRGSLEATSPSWRPTRDGAAVTGARPGLRLVVAAVTASMTLPFAVTAMNAVEASPVAYGGLVVWQLRAMIYGPLVMLVVSVGAARFQIGKATYWAWSLVFLGLAPAFQISRQRFPWRGSFATEHIGTAQTLILAGHVAFALTAWLMSRRRTRAEGAVPASAVDTPESHRRTEAQRRILSYLGLGYLVASSLFIALMGGALFNARAIFRSRVLEISSLPFGGFLYFAVTAGAIVIPGALLACRLHAVKVPGWIVTCCWCAAAVVTNPLVGSRFLTGSFLVATAVAVLCHSSLLRLVPVGSVVLLTVVFPSLDVLRGDDTGSRAVRLLSVEDSMLDYDFDAFEMGTREVSLAPMERAAMPSSTHMLIAPVARWIPIAARSYLGDAGGQVVAEATGMQYTNVSMPLWAEGHLIWGAFGTVAAMGALGAWVGLTGRGDTRRLSVPQIAALPGSTALLFIVLRGSIYEVLGYLGLAVAVYVMLARADKEKNNGKGSRQAGRRSHHGGLLPPPVPFDPGE